MELLDPKNNRVNNNIPKPNHKKLKKNNLFNDNISLNKWDELLKHLNKEGRLEKDCIELIIKESSKLLKNEPNLLYIQDPVSIIGDIHGQFFDMPTIINLLGNPENNKYLFLGDYVDRGMFGVEVIILLYYLKICFPNNIFLLRGNHESRELTNYFNFKNECLYKYDNEIYDLIIDSFDKLPLAAIINGRFLALHGGISPDLIFCSDFNTIDRFQEPTKSGILCDSLWSDPIEEPQGKISEGKYIYNNSRGCSYYFGFEAVNELLENNQLIMIIRAHEAQIEGYKTYLWDRSSIKIFPSVITIFSAPNYCGCYGNKGAILKLKDNNFSIHQFSNIEHPYFLPKFSNVFAWSIPFIAEQIVATGYNIIKENLEIEKDEIIEDIILPNEVYEALGINKPKTLKKSNSILAVKDVDEKIDLIHKEMKQIQCKRRISEQQINKIDINGNLISLTEINLDNSTKTFEKLKFFDKNNEKRPDNK